LLQLIAPKPISDINKVWNLCHTTCFAIDLYPQQHEHLLCNKCKKFLEDWLKGVIEKHATTKRAKSHQCERPWQYEGNNKGKLHGHANIRVLLQPHRPEDQLDAVAEAGDNLLTPVVHSGAKAKPPSSLNNLESAIVAHLLYDSKPPIA